MSKVLTLQMLPAAELRVALAAPNNAELFVGGVVDRMEVVLFRGDYHVLEVPLDWFSNPFAHAEPDPTRLHIRDFGQTVALGDFEAAARAILYAFDLEYRRRVRRRRH